jgi:hypothetical protein
MALKHACTHSHALFLANIIEAPVANLATGTINVLDTRSPENGVGAGEG